MLSTSIIFRIDLAGKVPFKLLGVKDLSRRSFDFFKRDAQNTPLVFEVRKGTHTADKVKKPGLPIRPVITKVLQCHAVLFIMIGSGKIAQKFLNEG